MESMKAEEYIEEWTFDAADLVDADGVGCKVVRRSEALKAVKMAAEEEHKLLTRWHDPSTPPDSNRYVLCRIGRNTYGALRYEKDKEDFIDYNGIAYVVTGWREIHE